MFVLFLLVLNLTTAEEEKVEEGGTGEQQHAIAKILSTDVFKNTVNGCTQVLETTSETDPLLIAHRVVDIADVDD